MSETRFVQSGRWQTARALASRSRQISARVVLEPDRLTIALSNGRTFTAPLTVSAELAIAAAVQWSQRHGATAVTVER